MRRPADQERLYLEAVLETYNWLPGTPARTSRQDRRLARELCRRGVHGRDVEPIADLERPMPIRRPPVARHPDSVAVDTRASVASRVETRGRRAERPQCQVGREDGIQPSPQLRPSDPLAATAASEAEGRDLAGGMHPGIGSPGEADSHPLAGQSVKRLLQLPLHRPHPRLVLGTGEVGPVVLDHRPCAPACG